MKQQLRLFLHGNAGQLEKYLKGDAPAANLKWILMDKLCRAEVISK